MKVNSSTTGNYINTVNRERELGKNDFFKILSAQLNFQDPLSGGDNTQYIAQMAQFSALEQMENLNKSFERLMNLQKIDQGSSLIGKEVTINSNDNFDVGIVDRVKINEGKVEVIVNERSYLLDEITEISNVIEEVTESQETVVNQEVLEGEENGL